MKKRLKDLKARLKTLSCWKWSKGNGGYHNLNYLNASVFFLIFVFNTADIILFDKGIIRFLLYSVPFLIFFIISIINSDKLDTFLNILLSLLLISTVIDGDLSGLPFLLLALYQMKNKKQFVILGVLIFIALGISSFKNGLTPLQASIVIVLYGYIMSKYYLIIHKPTQELKATIHFKDSVIENLQKQLSILGPRERLTDAEVIDKYRFLRYTRTDKDGNDDPYRKLHILHMLADGVEYKEICSQIGINDLNTLARTLKKIREELTERINGTISNNTNLVTICIQLGIIHIDITP